MSRANWRLVYSALQLGFLGVAPAVFLPFVIRAVPSESLPGFMLAQAWMAILSVLVQYGLHIQGPVDIGRATAEAERWQVLVTSWRIRAALLVVATLVYVFLLLTHFSWLAALPLLALLVFPFAFLINAGWYLQALGDFRSGALGAGVGALAGSACLLLLPGLEGSAEAILLSIAVLAGPQLGSCTMTAWVASRKRGLSPEHNPIVERAEDSSRVENSPMYPSSFRQQFMHGAPAALSHLAMIAYLSGGTVTEPALDRWPASR